MDTRNILKSFLRGWTQWTQGTLTHNFIFGNNSWEAGHNGHKEHIEQNFIFWKSFLRGWTQRTQGTNWTKLHFLEIFPERMDTTDTRNKLNKTSFFGNLSWEDGHNGHKGHIEQNFFFWKSFLRGWTQRTQWTMGTQPYFLKSLLQGWTQWTQWTKANVTQPNLT